MKDLISAVEQGNLEVTKELFSTGTFSQVEKDLALGRACCYGQLDVASFLVEQGADPNGRYMDGESDDYGPVILASCEFLKAEGVLFLLDQGANPNGYPPDSTHTQCCTPLEMVNNTYAKNEEGKRRCIDGLIAAGAEPLTGPADH